MHWLRFVRGCLRYCHGQNALPRGLVRFSTQSAVSKGLGQGRDIASCAASSGIGLYRILVALCVAMLASLVTRTPLKVDVERDRAALSRIVAGGKLENIYRLQIMNATEAPQRYRISARGLDGLELASEPEVAIDAAQSRWVAVRLQIPTGLRMLVLMPCSLMCKRSAPVPM